MTYIIYICILVKGRTIEFDLNIIIQKYRYRIEKLIFLWYYEYEWSSFIKGFFLLMWSPIDFMMETLPVGTEQNNVYVKKNPGQERGSINKLSI